jgi:hypothetical protein
MSHEKIFVDVHDVHDLANLLQSFTEDDFVKYDHESRKQICDELVDLCRQFKVGPPVFFKRVSSSNKLYDELAALRGLAPQSPLDYLNAEFDSDFGSYAEFRSWLAIQDQVEHGIQNARAVAEPEDDEMKEFLKVGAKQ